MKYVLDTNVIKRLSGPKPNVNVVKWSRGVNDSDLYITVMSILEIRKGIELLRKTGVAEKVAAADALTRDLDRLLADFDERILPVDIHAAQDWGRRLAKQGTKNANDLGIIAITATKQPAAAVTQNETDFRHRGVKMINPYDDPPRVYHDPET